MPFTIEPIAFVSAPRTTPDDDAWGGQVAEIRLTPGMDTSSLQGLDAIDGTPVVDIKPVMKEFLPRTEVTQPSWVSELMADYWCEP